jgi:hypothetical protein
MRQFQLLSIFMVWSYFSYAQFGMPMTNTIRTPHGPVKITTYQPMASTHMPMYYGNAGVTSVRYKFTIVLKNDSTITAYTKINTTDKTHTVKVKAKKESKIILPADTKEIYRINASGKKFSGMPTDSCWLFLSAKGKINTYSYLAEYGTLYAIAIQEGEDGPIQPLTKDNLMAMVGDDPRIKKMIEIGKYGKAIETYNAKP